MVTLFENKIVQEDMKEIYNSNIIDFRKLKGKSFLITGATGMLPSYLIFVLLYLNEIDAKNNIRIIAVARSKEKAIEKFGAYLNKNYFCLLQQDVCDEILIDGSIDYIVHGASLASSQFYGTNPVETLLPNILGTYHLLELARKKKSQGFLFFSSSEVYGKVEKKDKIREQDYGYLDPVDIRSCYAESKRMGENMCESWCHEYGIPTKSVRIYHTYGPTMDIGHDKRVFSEFVSNVVHKENIVLKSNGSPIRAFCYISDATTAFLKILLDGADGESYNMANPDCLISMYDLAQLMVSLKPEYGLKLVSKVRPNDNSYIENKQPNSITADITKINNLGWNPKIPLFEGFRRTVESFLEGNIE